MAASNNYPSFLKHDTYTQIGDELGVNVISAMKEFNQYENLNKNDLINSFKGLLNNRNTKIAGGIFTNKDEKRRKMLAIVGYMLDIENKPLDGCNRYCFKTENKKKLRNLYCEIPYVKNFVLKASDNNVKKKRELASLLTEDYFPEYHTHYYNVNVKSFGQSKDNAIRQYNERLKTDKTKQRKKFSPGKSLSEQASRYGQMAIDRNEIIKLLRGYPSYNPNKQYDIFYSNMMKKINRDKNDLDIEKKPEVLDLLLDDVTEVASETSFSGSEKPLIRRK